MSPLLPALVLAALCAGAADAPEKEIPPEKFYKDAALDRPRIAKAKELAKWLKEGSAVLLDLRSPASYERSHIKGAANLPGTELTGEAAAKVVASTGTRVVIYCDDNLGPTRMIALTTWGYPALRKLGYANVYRLEALWNSKDCREKKDEAGFGCERLLPMEGKKD